jgi:hypothetical protein
LPLVNSEVMGDDVVLDVIDIHGWNVLPFA